MHGISCNYRKKVSDYQSTYTRYTHVIRSKKLYICISVLYGTIYKIKVFFYTEFISTPGVSFRVQLTCKVYTDPVKSDTDTDILYLISQSR